MNKQIARQGISWVSSNWLSFGRVSNIKNAISKSLFFYDYFLASKKINKNKMTKYEVGNKLNEINHDLIISHQSNTNHFVYITKHIKCSKIIQLMHFIERFHGHFNEACSLFFLTAPFNKHYVVFI